MDIIDQLIRDEGVRNKMYLDSRGVPTIGVGHNLRDVPISNRAVRTILEDDAETARQALFQSLPWVTQLDDARLGVLWNMSFNLGIAGLLGFHNTLELVRTGKFSEAAAAMLQSKWAAQVGSRAARLAKQMETGIWQ